MAEFAYLTTRVRRTGEPQTIELWYGEFDGTIYLLSGSGERADWVGNLKQEPRVLIRLGGPREQRADVEETFVAVARIVTEPAEEDLARRLVARKYERRNEGRRPSEWMASALVVALEIDQHDQQPR
ncbi:MAG TPA: nitroreductase/quinone reductase family protein [Micromonosporaceae bacterium]|nr:nitroreductase/quinone reductase family protein [Micromonosporaceae bacterium]